MNPLATFGSRTKRIPWLLAASGLLLALIGPSQAIAAPSPAGGARPSGTAAVVANVEPPPTATPDAPGIVVATRGGADLPDPFLLDAGGRYHLFTSTAFGDRTHEIPELVGTPGHWTVREALGSLPPWAVPGASFANGGKDWAPTVYRFGSRYVMYYSPEIKGSLPVQHCIAVATSSSPSGPFLSRSQPMVCDRQQGGDIDAEVLDDPSGPAGATNPYYLVYKSDNNSTTGTGATTIWVQRLSNSGLRLFGSPVAVFQPSEAWQGNVIESPYMVVEGGRVWLFFSAGNFANLNYLIGYVGCNSPLGPCEGSVSRQLLTSNSQGQGPGEETIYTTRDGEVWMLYNPWSAGQAFKPFRPAQAVRLGFDSSGPYLAETTTFPPP
jgi:hypothetical protein